MNALKYERTAAPSEHLITEDRVQKFDIVGTNTNDKKNCFFIKLLTPVLYTKELLSRNSSLIL